MKRVTICSLMVILLLANGCSRHAVYEKIVIPSASLKSSENSEEWFHEIKSKWTIVIGSRGKRGGRGMMASAYSGGRGSSRELDFPLRVTATLMDEQVIEAGFRYYENGSDMSPGEIEHFQQTYRTLHDSEQYILIEANLRTTFAENYLDVTRWSIFLEDNQEVQHAPVRIVEMPVSTNHFEGMMEDPSQKRPFYINSTNHEKRILLYFPRYDYYGNSTIHEDLKYLKLVFLMVKEGTSRGEGTWIFK